jgi:S-disulfanyl-L-cysteine oxidoreductase SoxD
MFNSRDRWLAASLLLATGLALAQAPSPRFPGIGRDATPKEVAAWDIDVRPDFKGLPKGAGSVSAGQDIWEAKCAHCHGVFGESNEVFSPLVGGTTLKDIETGRVANLSRTDYPGRTTLMKVATISTLWDYINRAMPWTNPKTLKPDEVYAVTAYLLNLAQVVPDDFVLSDKNIADVQKRMPNRHGMNTRHGMWPGKEFGGNAQPDVSNVACMKDCATEPKLASLLPDYARNAHGNLSEQNRNVGPQRGADTSRPEGKASTASQSAAAESSAGATGGAPLGLLQKNTCTACHAMDKKLVGPSFQDIAKKHADKTDYLLTKIKSGGVGVWGQIPMPAQSLADADARQIANWLAKGAAK